MVSLGVQRSNNMGQGIVVLHYGQKGSAIEEERHLLVSSFLLARTRFVIPPADFFQQTEYSAVFSIIQFCLGPRDLSLPNAQPLGHAVFAFMAKRSLRI